MHIQLQDIGKKFNRGWIFKGINQTFSQDNKYALLGSNGSGKSTLLQIISGHNSASKGAISYSSAGKSIAVESIYKHLTMAAPALELPEDLTFREILQFNAKFKKPLLKIAEIISITTLQKHADKKLVFFSSGMKQRVKLALALFYNSDVILLDEPCSHLDENSRKWYSQIMTDISPSRLLIIASNDPQEYLNCNKMLNIEDFKL